jgi:hypothetical protein
MVKVDRHSRSQRFADALGRLRRRNNGESRNQAEASINLVPNLNSLASFQSSSTNGNGRSAVIRSCSYMKRCGLDKQRFYQRGLHPRNLPCRIENQQTGPHTARKESVAHDAVAVAMVCPPEPCPSRT